VLPPFPTPLDVVKNIAEPVRVWRMVMDETADALAGQAVLRRAQHERESIPVTLSLSKGDRKRKLGTAYRAWVVAAGLVLSLGMIVTVRYLTSPPLSTQSSSLITQVEPTSALPLPDKPSIVVLPFVNMSGDPERRLSRLLDLRERTASAPL
jgi:hypothetical protein